MKPWRVGVSRRFTNFQWVRPVLPVPRDSVTVANYHPLFRWSTAPDYTSFCRWSSQRPALDWIHKQTLFRYGALHQQECAGDPEPPCDQVHDYVPLLKTKLFQFWIKQLSRIWRMLALLTVQHMLPCRCVKIPSFTQTKYAKNLQPMNFGTGLNDVASRNVLSILTHTKSMEMAHVEHVLTLSAIQKTHSNTSMRVPTLIVFLWKIFQSVRKLKKSAWKGYKKRILFFFSSTKREWTTINISQVVIRLLPWKRRVKRTFTRLLRVPLLKTKLFQFWIKQLSRIWRMLSTIDSAAYAIMQMCENTIFHTNEIWKESSANELRCWLERCCIAKRIVNFDTYEVNGDGSRRTCFDIERNPKDALKYFYESSSIDRLPLEDFSVSTEAQEECMKRYKKRILFFFSSTKREWTTINISQVVIRLLPWKRRVKRTFTRLLRVPLLKTKLFQFWIKQLSRIWRMLALLTVQHMLPCRCVKIPSFTQTKICKESSANELRYWLERCCIAKRIVNFDTYEVNGDGSRRTRFDIERNPKDALKYFYESSYIDRLPLEDFSVSTEAQEECMKRYKKRILFFFSSTKKRMNDDQHITSCDTSSSLKKKGEKNVYTFNFESLSWKRNCFNFESSNCHEFDEC